MNTLLRQLNLERSLAAHSPTLIGAAALGLAASPLEVRCQSKRGFADRLRSVYGRMEGFVVEEVEGEVRCRFVCGGVPVVLTGAPGSVRRHREMRVFRVQVRLLRLLGAPLQARLQARLKDSPDLEAACCAAVGVSDLLILERASNPVILDAWSRASRRPLPAPPRPAPPSVSPTAPPTAPQSAPPPAPPAEEPSLLKPATPLLHRRRMVSGSTLMPVSSTVLPAPPKRGK